MYLCQKIFRNDLIEINQTVIIEYMFFIHNINYFCTHFTHILLRDDHRKSPQIFFNFIQYLKMLILT